MSRIRVVLLAQEKKDPFLTAATDYLERAGRRYDATLQILRPEKRGKGHDDRKIREQEAVQLRAHSEGTTRIALDAGGVLQDTPAFARALEAILARGRPVSYLIGGATGLDPSLRDEADAVWSLSPLTFPHRLVALVVAEQIYRASEISRGGPYAK